MKKRNHTVGKIKQKKLRETQDGGKNIDETGKTNSFLSLKMCAKIVKNWIKTGEKQKYDNNPKNIKEKSKNKKKEPNYEKGWKYGG